MGGSGFNQTNEQGEVEVAAPAGSVELTVRTKDWHGKTTATVPASGTTAAEVTLGPLEGTPPR